jgi:hypothetical protein
MLLKHLHVVIFAQVIVYSVRHYQLALLVKMVFTYTLATAFHVPLAALPALLHVNVLNAKLASNTLVGLVFSHVQTTVKSVQVTPNAQFVTQGITTKTANVCHV